MQHDVRYFGNMYSYSTGTSTLNNNNLYPYTSTHTYDVIVTEDSSLINIHLNLMETQYMYIQNGTPVKGTSTFFLYYRGKYFTKAYMYTFTIDIFSLVEIVGLRLTF